MINNKFLQQNYSSDQIKLFEQYLELLNKWNKTYNLTAITDLDKMVVQHLLDSLVINPFLHGARICDVGSGAGLPGIPLAIVNPNKQFTLLDANNKKIRFLTQVKIELKLSNIEVIHSRAEQFQPKICFNTIVSRAFSAINVMLCKTKHLCCDDGAFLAMKGADPQNELDKIENTFKVVWIKELQVPELNAQRCLVKIVKTNGDSK